MHATLLGRLRKISAGALMHLRSSMNYEDKNMLQHLKGFVALLAVAGLCAAISAAAVHTGRDLLRGDVPAQQTGDYSRYFSATQQDVVLFGTSTCPFCKDVRDHLAKRGVRFADLVVDKDESAAELFESLDSDSVPVLLIGATRINVFAPEQIDAAIKTWLTSACGELSDGNCNASAQRDSIPPKE